MSVPRSQRDFGSSPSFITPVASNSSTLPILVPSAVISLLIILFGAGYLVDRYIPSGAGYTRSLHDFILIHRSVYAHRILHLDVCHHAAMNFSYLPVAYPISANFAWAHGWRPPRWHSIYVPGPFVAHTAFSRWRWQRCWPLLAHRLS